MIETSPTQEPPYSFKLLFVKGCIRFVVTLHKIIGKLINFQPTPTRFWLDTLKSTKKYVLDFEYPGGVTVITDPEPEAVFEHGILKVDLVVADWGELTKKRGEILDIHNKRLLDIKNKKRKRSQKNKITNSDVKQENKMSKKDKRNKKIKRWNENQYVEAIKNIIVQNPTLGFSGVWKKLREQQECQMSKFKIRKVMRKHSLILQKHDESNEDESNEDKKKNTEPKWSKKKKANKEKKLNVTSTVTNTKILTKKKKKEKKRLDRNEKEKNQAMALIEGINKNVDTKIMIQQQKEQEQEKKFEEMMQIHKQNKEKRKLRKKQLREKIIEEEAKVNTKKKKKNKETIRQSGKGQKGVSFKS